MDKNDFDLFLQIAIEEVAKVGHEVFGCRLCSPSALSETTSGEFVNALMLHHFDWSKIRNRLDKLLLHASSCENWASAIEKLAPYIQYADAE